MSDAATMKVTPAKKERPGPLDYMRRWPIQAWLIAVTIFLYAPLISLMVFSFNDSKRNVVWQGFTLKYYEKALTNASLIEAFSNSLVIALCSTILSVIVGAMAAIALWRFRFPGRALLEVSGGVTLDQWRAIAAIGVDRISRGTLTKDVRAVDCSMRIIGAP